ncbi:MAG: hypothetical protein OXU73_02300 [Candidatus Campbellbacteria bacterium]|nr:hypothetical protein [Candidatus Campbellbacteria bacterium]
MADFEYGPVVAIFIIIGVFIIGGLFTLYNAYKSRVEQREAIQEEVDIEIIEAVDYEDETAIVEDNGRTNWEILSDPPTEAPQIP